MKRHVTFVLITVLLMILGIATAEGNYSLKWSGGTEVVVISLNASIRETPSVRATKIEEVTSNTIMTIIEELDDWYKVLTPRAQVGFVRKQYVTRNFGHIHFSSLALIRAMPYEDARVLISPGDVVGKTFLVVGRFGEWVKLKVGKGIGFVRTDNLYYYNDGDYCSYREEDFFTIVSYGRVFLYTDPFIASTEDGAAIGERVNESFVCIGYWDDCWVVKYGDGVAFIDKSSPIITQQEIKYYYNLDSQRYVYTKDTEIEVKGKNGTGSIGTIAPGTKVRVLAEEDSWYVIPYSYMGIHAIGWIRSIDTISEQDYLNEQACIF